MKRKGGWGKGEKEQRGGDKKEGIKIGFWNVAGIRGKDEEFWERIKEWDIIGLVETWVEKKDWEYWKGRVPKDYNWEVQRRKIRKGGQGEEYEWGSKKN